MRFSSAALDVLTTARRAHSRTRACRFHKARKFPDEKHQSGAPPRVKFEIVVRPERYMLLLELVARWLREVLRHEGAGKVVEWVLLLNIL